MGLATHVNKHGLTCEHDLSEKKKKYAKVTLCSLPLEVITVWKELLKTQESSINPQDLLDTGSFM